jgi:hypothetical protein
VHTRFEIRLETIEWDFRGWLKSLLPQIRVNLFGKIDARREALSARRALLARHAPLLDKHGY